MELIFLFTKNGPLFNKSCDHENQIFVKNVSVTVLEDAKKTDFFKARADLSSHASSFSWKKPRKS